LALYPEQVQEIASAARRLLKATLPGVEETVVPPAKLLGYSYGRGYKGLVCTVIMSQTGVKLGIFRGSELPDPKRLMAGTGKVHRHVQLSAVEDIKRPGLSQLLKAALAAWRERNQPTGKGAVVE
jgi:hypothetical protein